MKISKTHYRTKTGIVKRNPYRSEMYSSSLVLSIPKQNKEWALYLMGIIQDAKLQREVTIRKRKGDYWDVIIETTGEKDAVRIQKWLQSFFKLRDMYPQIIISRRKREDEETSYCYNCGRRVKDKDNCPYCRRRVGKYLRTSDPSVISRAMSLADRLRNVVQDDSYR